MFETTKAKVIGLIAVGVVVLGAATYTTTVLTAGAAAAAPAPAPIAQTATDPQLRADILQMLKDRMGLTGADAEKFADQMIGRMKDVDPNFDLQDMVNRCNQLNSDWTKGQGMMGGNGSCYGGGPANGRGMMGGNGSSYGGAMMGGWGVN